MVLNPAGVQMVADGGAPRIITGTARVALSGGMLVAASGASAAVSSGANSFATTDITFDATGSGALFTGVCLTTADSGTSSYVSVATRGTFILTAAGTVAAGRKVVANGAHAVIQQVGTGSQFDEPIGRALTGAGSEGYVLVDIHG